MGILRGFGDFLGGWRLLKTERPDLFPLVLWPTLISLVLLAAVLGLGVQGFSRLHAGLLARLGGGKTASFMVSTLLVVTIPLVAMAVFLMAQSIVAAPFKELLSAHTEAHLLGRPARKPTAGEFVASLAHELGKLAIYAGLLVALYVLAWLIPGLGALALAVGAPLLTVLFLAFNHIDHGMCRRGMSFAAKWQFVGQNLGAVLGFGGALSLWLLIPVFGAVTLPVAAIGGTVLFLRENGEWPAPTG